MVPYHFFRDMKYSLSAQDDFSHNLGTELKNVCWCKMPGFLLRFVDEVRLVNEVRLIAWIGCL